MHSSGGLRSVFVLSLVSALRREQKRSGNWTAVSRVIDRCSSDFVFQWSWLATRETEMNRRTSSRRMTARLSLSLQMWLWWWVSFFRSSLSLLDADRRAKERENESELNLLLFPSLPKTKKPHHLSIYNLCRALKWSFRMSATICISSSHRRRLRMLRSSFGWLTDLPHVHSEACVPESSPSKKITNYHCCSPRIHPADERCMKPCWRTTFSPNR